MLCGTLTPTRSQPVVAFPETQPQNGNFNRPRDGQVLDISPPGFCWWRAGERDEVFYRLKIHDLQGKAVYESAVLRDPVEVPDKVLPAGTYTWTVDALNEQGDILATRPAQFFTITDNALALPWIEPAKLLAKVDHEHPRLLFPKAELESVRASLSTTRREAFEMLIERADEALDLPLMPKPDFDKYDIETEYPARRTAYRAAYHQFTETYHGGMTPLALAYLLTGDRKYGERAKAHLLNLLDWETDGIASLKEGFDEIGLRIARTAPQAYDWLYDLLTDEERNAVRNMLIDHGNNMLARLQRRDFLNYAAFSHDGRLPGYLVEFSIALAEEPIAEQWMDYAMRALLTVFPHWAGSDGGWAEGVNYFLSYNDRFVTPLHSLEAATGYNLFNKPYFRKMRYFPVYCMAPNGDITPFGDGEAGPAARRAGEARSILQYHALRFRDPAIRWWVDQEPMRHAPYGRTGPLLRIILPDDLPPVPPHDLPSDRVFRGIGWAAMHTDLTQPDRDLMVLFKSSPFGAVSHSHADQNSFVIMKGGKALAIPGGQRYPQHGSPFHTRYTQQTVAHNCLLINGQGQVNQDNRYVGRITDFNSLQHVAHVSGKASGCYPDGLLERYERHVVLLRPGVILVIDDVLAPEPVEIQWLMHGKEAFELNPEKQAFVSIRDSERMRVQLISTIRDGFAMKQTDAWPLPPKTDYPMVTAPEPAPQWHLTATANSRTRAARIAAVMLVAENGEYPNCKTQRVGSQLKLRYQSEAGTHECMIDLNPDNADRSPLIEVQFNNTTSNIETLRVF
ncbi:MAG: alginate lyase [Phycisphaeraceae bacterium]